jgi:hypothetical protein
MVNQSLRAHQLCLFCQIGVQRTKVCALEGDSLGQIAAVERPGPGDHGQTMATVREARWALTE